MNLLSFDNVLQDPTYYVSEIYSYGFQDVADGQHIFRNIQPRGSHDDFAKYVSKLFPDYKVEFNFVRRSPLNQEEPNFIHSDEMMGDITVILYLNEESPKEDGTTIYDDQGNPLCKFYSKFNRMVAFESEVPHSRNIYENFGEERSGQFRKNN